MNTSGGKMKKRISALCFCLALMCSLFAQTGKKVEPGYWDSKANDDLEKAIQVKNKLQIADDEFAILYVRKDKSYDSWALWIWPKTGGDGSILFPYSQDWKVEDGIGYMRFKLDGSTTGGNKIVDAEGNCGLIVRKDEGWTKDGDADRFWNVNVANACIVFQGDSETYSAGAYKPKIATATVTDATTLTVVLSHNYGLDTKQGNSGFLVMDKVSGKELNVIDAVNANQDREFNYARRVTISLAEPISPSSSLVISHPVFEAPKDIDMAEYAWKSVQGTLPSENTELGMNYDSKTGKAVFNLWAPTSSQAVLNLYKDYKSATPDKSYPLTFDKNSGVWSCTFTDAVHGWFYDIEITNALGTNKALDPYAKSMAAYRNQGGSGRAAIVDLNSPEAQPEGGWTTDYVSLAQREDAIIYEVSVRDFTIAPDANVKNIPGTYKAFIEKLPYLKELGITHIQLMPVLNFYFTDETNQDYEDSGTANNNNYNWGYDPHNYFTPEGWYASNPEDPFSRISELKTLINEAHKLGIGVLLDVVYNHMANTSFLDQIVPGYFFRTKNGALTSNSGCGNDIASERDMARRLIVDSTRYWVEEYKVDGFRFDLMGLTDSETMLITYNNCATINKDTLFIGEGWKMYNGPSDTVALDQKYMVKTDSIAVFNDEFRDAVKAGGYNEQGQGFITKSFPGTLSFFNNIIGQPMINYRADDPGDNVQYIVAHDGLTLHDSVVHNAKLNESTSKGKAEIIRRIKMGNFLALTSQGIAFVHAGQEKGRSKPGEFATTEKIGNFVRNSYDSADNVNQIFWNIDADYKNLQDYTKGLIALRKASTTFRLGSMAVVNEKITLLEDAINNNPAIMAYKISDVEGYDWYVVMNAGEKSATVKFADTVKKAEVLVDAKQAGTTPIAKPEGVKLSSKSVKLDALTATIFRVKK